MAVAISTAELAVAPPRPAMRLSDLDVYRDPEVMRTTAATFLLLDDWDGIAWLQYLQKALGKGEVEAITCLQAGDSDGALKALNRSRDATLVTIVTSAVRNADGTWLLTSSDGRTVRIDADKEAAAMLTREGYVKASEEQQSAGIELSETAEANQRDEPSNETVDVPSVRH
jgi:hypothetical protein